MGGCRKCGKEVELLIDERDKKEYWVCHPCKSAWHKCEVYSRVCGYLRPIDGWNKGKKEEFLQRKTYKVQPK